MKLHEFLVLSKEEQTDLLYHEGVYLGKRKVNPFTLVLYSLDSFYVEIRYKNYRRHIYSLYGFDHTDHLDPYLPRIDFKEWINY